ncbi:hypothetical protein F4779DRAFT_185485 [Xylariaceae sp. FL0662B]|nr:hypothetical protein F4779DRAFT_185485 [Xylariaceae sp. FL0662B]
MSSNDTVSTRVSPETKARARHVIAFGQRQVDRVVSPTTRQKAYDTTTSYANERPLLFSFLALQLFLASTPLLLFIGFALSTVIFTLVCGVAFILFWASIALLILLPTLATTFVVSTGIWAWGTATFHVGRWVYSKLPARARVDGDGGHKGGDDKRVIFGKSPKDNKSNGLNLNNIKAEAAEVRD